MNDMTNQPLFRALNGLQKDIDDLAQERSKWRRRSMAALTVALLSSGVAVAAITTTTHAFEALQGDVFTHDESKIAFVVKGMGVQDEAASAVGTSSGASVEATAALAGASTAISAGDWFYEVQVKEASVAAIGSGTFKVELFQDGTSKGALYMTQGTPDAATVEGVTAKWSLGSSLPPNAAYVVKVTAA